MNHSTLKRDFILKSCSISIFLILLFLTGCSITDDYQRPEIELPKKWRLDIKTASKAVDVIWWEQFNDETLNNLIKTSLQKSKDLRIALARIEEFKGRAQAVNSELYPQVNYGITASRQQRSSATDYYHSNRVFSDFGLTLPVNWELDVWGKIARSTEAARADLLSVEENQKAVLMTLVTDVAINYVKLLILDERLKISKRTLSQRQELVNLFKIKKDQGKISSLEYAQVLSAYEEIKVLIPEIESLISVQENFLSVLTGVNPGTIHREGSLDTLSMPAIISGMPSELLARRPDIRQKEQMLVAANARIGVVKTKYFPSISLTSLLGYASADLSDLLTGSANLWNVGAGIAGPLFTGGRISGELLQAEAIREQLLNEYLKTVQTAFREVNDALVSLQKQKEQCDDLKDYQKVLQDYVKYAQLRYDTGYIKYLSVLDAQRRLYAAEIKYAQTKGSVLLSIINLYKALGGGWITEANSMVESEPDYSLESSSVK